MFRTCGNFFVDATSFFVALTKMSVAFTNLYVSLNSMVDFVSVTKLFFQCISVVIRGIENGGTSLCSG